MFPLEISSLIAEYCVDEKIKIKNFFKSYTVVNSSTFFENDYKTIKYLTQNLHTLSIYNLFHSENIICNPHAADFILENITDYHIRNGSIKFYSLCLNRSDKIIDYIDEKINEYIVYYPEETVNNLLLNFNPRVLNIIKKIISIAKKTHIHSFNDKYFHFLIENDLILFHNLSSECLSRLNSDISLNFLENNIDNIDWGELSRNPHDRAIALLEKNIDRVDWDYICQNKNPRCEKIIRDNISRIEFSSLCMYTNLIAILKDNYKKIDWRCLSRNENDEALLFLRENVHMIDWGNFFYNSKCYDIVIENLESIKYQKIDIGGLSSNKKGVEIIEKLGIAIHTSERYGYTPYFKHGFVEVDMEDYNYQIVFYRSILDSL